MTEVTVFVSRYADFASVTGHRPTGSPNGYVKHFLPGDVYGVFINERDGLEEQVHTLAHECAHIALGHIDPQACSPEEQAERLSCFLLGFAKVMARELQEKRETV